MITGVFFSDCHELFWISVIKLYSYSRKCPKTNKNAAKIDYLKVSLKILFEGTETHKAE